MAISSSKSAAECKEWVQRVHDVQTHRMTPEQRASYKARMEQQRHQEVMRRKCKAVKSHAVRSDLLVTEGLRQMSASAAPADFGAARDRWAAAQRASESRALTSVSKYAADAMGARREAEVLREDEDAEEEEELAEAACLIGAAGASALAVSAAGGAGGGHAAEALLGQLRTEPSESEECKAKFSLYEGYLEQVEKMRASLYTLFDESKEGLPSAVKADMEGQLRGIDNDDAMGIPDDEDVWFVYFMMRQAERNNRAMAAILTGFEKKLEFLAKSEQAECPICLETFKSEGPNVAETLSCCHRVCRECWEHWTVVTHNRPFCPLCKNEEFLGAVHAAMSR